MNQLELDSYHQDSLLKIPNDNFKSNTFLHNTFYPSPESPSYSTTTEQVIQNDDWLNQLDHKPFYSTCENHSFSEVSSLGTPDMNLSDMYGYTNLLNQTTSPTMFDLDPIQFNSFFQPPPPPIQNQQSPSTPLIPSLYNNDQFLLFNKELDENQSIDQSTVIFNSPDHTFISTPTTPYPTSYPAFFVPSSSSSTHSILNHSTPILNHLSREQLIHRVVQLEMEKSNRSTPTLLVQPNEEQQPKQSQNENQHSCLWVNCQAKAPTLEKLMTHICESHIGSGKASYFCEWKDCGRNKKPFMKRHKMHNHMRTHTGERPFICTVLGCNKTFSRPDSLSTHIKTHSDIRPYLCQVPDCEKAYFHSRSLRKHVKSTHMKKPCIRKSTKKNKLLSIQLDQPQQHIYTLL